MNSTNYCLVMTTTDDYQTAIEISNRLVETNLAACCSISSPIQSVYKWKGKTETNQEYQLLIKTRIGNFENIIIEINKIHNYEVPEIIQIPIDDGNKEYLNWIDESLDHA